MTADPCSILASARRIAVLGMSPKPQRTSHQIALYLQRVGFEIVPVNPGHDEILGLPCYPRLKDIPAPVDIVDVFRAATHEHEVAGDILEMATPPKAAWFQFNAGGFNVEQQLRESGIQIFVDRCIKIDNAGCEK
jgi:hypothetical protein